MTASAEVHLWVRATLDWADERAVDEGLIAGFRPKLETWNATFALPYHVFRQRVCEIATANRARVVGAVESPWEAIPDGAIVLPVDDDDWFAPDVATVLAAIRGDSARIGWRWPARFLEAPIGVGHRIYLTRRRVLPFTPPKHLCSTNSYALVKQPGTELVARRHVRASRLFAEQAALVGVVGRPLSCVNRTLASQTTLLHHRETISRRRLLRKAERYARLYRRVRLDGIEWAAEYVDRMAALMDELVEAGVRP